MQDKATVRRRARLTTERLLDRAEGFMQMNGLSATAAVRKAMPDELLQIPIDDLRSLVESALTSKLASRRSRERYRDTERRAAQVQRLTADALGRVNRQVQEKAAVLARITYIMHGVPTPLLTMSLEDHISKRTEAERVKLSASERFSFHDAAVKALKDASVDTISSLSQGAILELAGLAERVWGDQPQ